MSGTDDNYESENKRLIEIIEYLMERYGYTEPQIERVIKKLNKWGDKVFWHVSKKELDILNRIVLLYGSGVSVEDIEKIERIGKKQEA